MMSLLGAGGGVDLQPPAAPSPTSVAASSTSISTTWPAVTGATSYNGYYRTPSGSGSYTEVTGITSPWVLTGLAANTNYGIVVSAVNAGGETKSGEQSVTTIPAAPTGLTAAPTPSSLTTVTVSFTASTGATSYNLYEDGTKVVTGFTSGSTYTPGDSNSHTYTVTAVNASGESTQSSGATAATWTPSQLPAGSFYWDAAQTVYSDAAGTTPATDGGNVLSWKDELQSQLLIPFFSSSDPLTYHNDGTHYPYVSSNGVARHSFKTTLGSSISQPYTEFFGFQCSSSGVTYVIADSSAGTATITLTSSQIQANAGSALSGSWTQDTNPHYLDVTFNDPSGSNITLDGTSLVTGSAGTAAHATGVELYSALNGTSVLNGGISIYAIVPNASANVITWMRLWLATRTPGHL